ncbi:hypothetical protein ACOME3_009223 [Neoechinorhynchus agilis]
MSRQSFSSARFDAGGIRNQRNKAMNVMRSSQLLAAAIQHNEDEFDGILSSVQLKHIREHKYKSSGRSVLDSSFQPFWNFVVELIPLHIAPNLLTIIGLLANIITSLVLFYHCPTATEQPPRIPLLLCTISLFVYQTLDAIDGKQARRTNSSSPLGELFDHGCDTLSTVFLIGNSCVCLRVGYWPWFMMFLFMMVLSAFYIAHWQTYVTGELKFGYIDVTEAQCTAMIFQLFCAFVGTQWLIPVDDKQYKLLSVLTTHITNAPAIVLAMLIVVGCSISLVTNLSHIPDGGIGVNGSSVADSSIVFPGFQLILVILSSIVIARKSPSRIFESHPILYLFTFGLVWCKYTNRLIVAIMTRSNVRMYDTTLTGPITLLLNQYFNCLVNERILLLIALFYCSFDLIRYNTRVCTEIANYLGIYVFRIGTAARPTEDSNTRRTVQNKNK